MRDFIFDTPYWFLGLLAVIGAALWISGNSRQNDNLKRAALATFLLAVALALLSILVDTDKEKVIKRTRQLIAAVEKQDPAGAAKLLHPQVQLFEMDKPAILNRIASAASQFHIKSIRINSIDVQPMDRDLSAVMSATTDVDLPIWSGGVPSSWKMVWEKTDQGWLLRDISPINVPGIDSQTLSREIKGK
jgi:hypothetical protein